MATRSSAQAEISTREYGLRVAPKSTPKAGTTPTAGARRRSGQAAELPDRPQARGRRPQPLGRPTTAGSARTVRGAMAKKYGSVAKGLAAHRRLRGIPRGPLGRSIDHSGASALPPGPRRHRPARASTRRAV